MRCDNCEFWAKADRGEAWHTMPIERDLLTRLLNFQYADRGFGTYACRSCGAFRFVDYGDDETPTTERRESCSATCPWGQARRLVEANDET